MHIAWGSECLRQVLAELAEGDYLCLDQGGRITAAYPFSATATPHTAQITGGPVAFSMCAIDALGIAEMLGAGVLVKSADPSTGEPKIMGEYLFDAQGEDVVAGIRTPLKLDDVKAPWCGELEQLCYKLEAMYVDMVDLEFTVQNGELFILQSRTGKRSARAAFKIAVDLVNEGVIDRGTARSRLTVEQFKVVRRPSIDPALMIRMLIIGYCYGIRSERQLCEEVELHLAYRWFCRLDLDDQVPDHSTFSVNRHGRFRDSDMLRQVFEAVVRACLCIR